MVKLRKNRSLGQPVVLVEWSRRTSVAMTTSVTLMLQLRSVKMQCNSHCEVCLWWCQVAHILHFSLWTSALFRCMCEWGAQLGTQLSHRGFRYHTVELALSVTITYISTYTYTYSNDRILTQN